MSVLSRPRIHFFGYTDWSPCTGNNSSSTYLLGPVEPTLNGMTFAEFRQWIRSRDPNLLQPRGSWNLYGDNATRFADARITGGQLATGNAAPADPLLGQVVDLQGLVYSDGPAPARLVMTDPYTGGEATSQIFYQWIVVGVVDGPMEKRIGFKAAASGRMFSRWPYQNRNLGISFKEGMVGCIWQAAARNQDIQWYGVERSPALAALKAAATSGGNQGILMRFASYRTLYYQTATFQGKRITNGLELVAAYQQGFTGDNPARSAMLGTFGIWEAGELASAGTQKLLAPASAQIANGGGVAPLGPAMAKVDTARQTLVIDLISAIPEQNAQLDKVNLGTLQVRAIDSVGKPLNIASLPYQAYDRKAYEASGGISEFPVPSGTTPAVDAGTIEISQEQIGVMVPVLKQTRFVAETDDWGLYVDEGETVSVSVTVTENGGPPKSPVRLFLQQYDSNGNLVCKPVIRIVDPAGNAVANDIVPVVSGVAKFGVRSLEEGACFLAFYPFVGDKPPSVPGSGFPFPTSFYCCVRMLPFDNELERNTPDSKLSWSFIYNNVLSVYDLIYPIMSVVRNLADRNVVEAIAEQIKFAISLDSFESTLYMPITRDLSAGKRKLLQRFVNLLPNRVPPDPPAAPVKDVVQPPTIQRTVDK